MGNTPEKERNFDDLDAQIHAQLKNVEPSIDGEVRYRPCSIKLKDGNEIDNVYVVEAAAYFSTWGVWPEDDAGKSFVLASDVESVSESPNRLPPEIANTIYKTGETGMGYVVFKLVFNDRSEQSYITGNAVDFIKYPFGLGRADIKKVIPHKGRESAQEGAKYSWCLYRKLQVNRR